jgi:hypothetical protein
MLATLLLSHAGDLVVAQCRYQVMLVTMLSSHAIDGTARAIWPPRDVDAESCWRRCCRVMLAMVLLGRLGRGVF